MQTQDHKKVAEAVVIATLCAVCTGLVGIGMELLKRRIFKPEQPKETSDKSKQT